MTHKFEIPESYVTEQRVERPYGYDVVSTRTYPDGTCEITTTSYYTVKILNTSGVGIANIVRRTEQYPPNIERSHQWLIANELIVPIEEVPIEAAREYPQDCFSPLDESPRQECKYLSRNPLLRCAVHPRRESCEGCMDMEIES